MPEYLEIRQIHGLETDSFAATQHMCRPARAGWSGRNSRFVRVFSGFLLSLFSDFRKNFSRISLLANAKNKFDQPALLSSCSRLHANLCFFACAYQSDLKVATATSTVATSVIAAVTRVIASRLTRSSFCGATIICSYSLSQSVSQRFLGYTTRHTYVYGRYYR